VDATVFLPLPRGGPRRNVGGRGSGRGYCADNYNNENNAFLNQFDTNHPINL